jgi:hypothetical protein
MGKSIESIGKNTPTAPSLGAEQEPEKRWQIKVKVINRSSGADPR